MTEAETKTDVGHGFILMIAPAVVCLVMIGLTYRFAGSDLLSIGHLVTIGAVLWNLWESSSIAFRLARTKSAEARLWALGLATVAILPALLWSLVFVPRFLL